MKMKSTNFMKMLMLAICSMTSIFQLQAQTDTFAPIGAEWYHYREAADISNSGKYLFHSQSVADATIDNHICRKVKTTYNVMSNTLAVPLNPTVGDLYF